MKIQFSTEGAAFKDEYEIEIINNIHTRREIIRILKKITDEIEYGADHGPIMDINGNKIGEWSI